MCVVLKIIILSYRRYTEYFFVAFLTEWQTKSLKNCNSNITEWVKEQNCDHLWFNNSTLDMKQKSKFESLAEKHTIWSLKYIFISSF